MNNQEEFKEVIERYEYFLKEVNLLLYKQHELRLYQQIYQREMQSVDRMITHLKQTKQNSHITIEAEEQYLKEIIKSNAQHIRKLKDKEKDKQSLAGEMNMIRKQQDKYLRIIETEFQSSIQQKLSTIRGKVDELKKKIKEINKQITSLQEQHFEQIDEYSLNLKILKDYQSRGEAMREEIEELREKIEQSK